MSRNKNRSPQASSAGASAVATQQPSKPRAVAAATKAKPEERFWLAVWMMHMARWLGSLQIAVFGLALFAVVLAIGTMVESWYSGKIAQELVYRTWWFALLLGILGINIFFAAVKKWPWKKHQTGFLITHLGLITMVIGGILNSLGGVDAFIMLIDSDQSNVQRIIGLPQESSHCDDKDEATIRVNRSRDSKDSSLVYSFRPGSLAWRSDEYLQRDVHPLLEVLDWLAHPLPRYWVADLGRGAELEVLGSYPHARIESYSAATAEDTKTFPAVKFSLTSPYAQFPSQWVAYRTRDQAAQVGPASAEMLGSCPTGLLAEFLRPPVPAELGKKGQLVIRLGDDTLRLAVDQKIGAAAEPVGKGGYKAQILRYTPNIEDESSEQPESPSLEFALIAPDGKISKWLTAARFAGKVIPASEKADPLEAKLQVWYHVPDVRFGRELRAVLQFVTDGTDQLYYRTYHSSQRAGEMSPAVPGGEAPKAAKDTFHFEKSGTIDEGKKDYDIWQGMNWTMHVEEYLPHAVARERYIPVNLRPGIEQAAGVVPAIRCKLSSGKDSKEFWLGQTGGGSTEVSVAGEKYMIGYNVKRIDLGFDIKLLRAEQPVDPGTNSPAMYTSYVQVTDPKANILGEDRYITMNQPLAYGGYKFFQSDYKFLDMDPETGKPVNRSGFTVSRDPGLALKYAGSSMLALGIACMFYMKAYFFKSRRRQPATPDAA